TPRRDDLARTPLAGHDATRSRRQRPGAILRRTHSVTCRALSRAPRWYRHCTKAGPCAAWPCARAPDRREGLVTATILYVVDSLGLSGKTRALAQLATRLVSDRFQSVVATFEPPKGLLAEQLARAKIPVVHVPCGDGLNAATIARLVRVSRAFRPT